MAGLGLQAYRFSVAWPRIQPEGRGRPNRRGLDHYRRLVDALLLSGIQPVLTLYHWDLPQALEDIGGWTNRDTAGRFSDYAESVHGALREDVALWITLNEPWVAAWHGYGTGIHAPGRRNDVEALAASHHQLLAHALAAQALRAAGADRVGITLNFTPTRPASDHPDDITAADLVDQHMNRLYLDPLVGRGYPPELLQRYRPQSGLEFVRPGDLESIHQPLDFLGVNYYTTHTVTARPRAELRAVPEPGHLGAWTFVPAGVRTTAMGWAIDPTALTELLSRLRREYPAMPLLVTENGAAFDDRLDPGGSIDDAPRIRFLEDHILAVHEAMASGVEVLGYFVWSLLDNFEWAEGYSKRFGLVYVDYPSQQRIKKRSADWYAGVVARRGLDRDAGMRAR
jgi:beta-glucosidase